MAPLLMICWFDEYGELTEKLARLDDFGGKARHWMTGFVTLDSLAHTRVLFWSNLGSTNAGGISLWGMMTALNSR
jgi:hypothetical protein